MHLVSVPLWVPPDSHARSMRHQRQGMKLTIVGAAPLRLLYKTSTPSSVQGILQIFYNGQWGTICDDYWDMTDTNIACKQLGYKSSVSYKYLGRGSGPIWLDLVKCNGDESSLDQCKHRGWGKHNCRHTEDVGVVCYAGPAPLRLQRKTFSPSLVHGVLQIYHNGQWGTICNRTWEMSHTSVACKQLGFKSAENFKYLGQGTGPIWLDNVKCNGGESSLHQCQHRGWGVHSCSHSQDVGIVCTTGTAPLRLLGKTSSPSLVQGILQIYHNGQWGTICNDTWGSNETNVACKVLGYERAVRSRHLGQGPDPIWLGGAVDCNSGESSLNQCQHLEWGKQYCTHSQDVGIVCYTGPPVQVRLIGDVPNAGRVQLLYKGVWKNLCDRYYYWNSNAAKVICRMAGYPDGHAVRMDNYKGSGDVWLSSYSCSGFELSIELCWNLDLGKATCSDNSLAGVVCKSGSPNVSYRLVNGSVPHAGRLEMRYYGLWRPVYSQSGLRLNDVHVICRMMGYNQGIINFINFEEKRRSYYVDMYCKGFENTTEQCGDYVIRSFSYGRYGRQGTIWIVCKPHTGFRLTVRLMDGISLNEGRVEIGNSGVWGNVRVIWYRPWSLTVVDMVCRMLGYRNVSWTGRARVSGNGLKRLFSHCTGNETSLEYCKYFPRWSFWYSIHYMRFQSHDLRVRCSSYQDPVTLQIRQETSFTPHSGRVGVRYGNSWSTLCYEGLDYPDVKVICRMLGYVDVNHVYAVRTPSSTNGRVWLSGVECNGTEASILNCSRTGWWQTTCDFDAVITCKTQAQTAVDIRLENGAAPHSGRVGIRYGNTWGTLCNKGMDKNDGKVICRMLGYDGVSHVFTIPGNATIWLSDLECNGEEDSIADCSHSGWWQTSHCTHDHDAAVTCKLDSAVILNLAKAAKPLDVRLESSYQFMVEKGPAIPYPITSHSNKTMETCSSITKTVFKDSYIAAEVPASPNDATSFTIGDGLYYHGYHNVPLEPGCVYRVYLRIVTMAMDGKKILGKSSFVRFATTSFPVENPPEFQISDSRSIQQKSAKITFLRKQQRKPKVYKRWYQVIVERTGIDVFLSKDMRVNHSYIAAEIPTTSSTFTIGDGLNYDGYNNAPLEPGCNYKAYVRVVTMAPNEKRVISDAPFVSFTTKSGAQGHTQGHSDKNSNDPLVIGLAVVLVMSIVALIGHIVYHVMTKRRKKERKTDDNPQIEISDAVRLAGIDSHYQSLVQQNRPQQREGIGKESAYHYISNVVVRPGKSTLSHMEEPIYERPI
ncbi:Scavenger receptor cysteine-rich type 1 protein M130 [Exaiptasia diaphana]|nr:Scavenger receptor cysteine-rich type 1 protein M130 [Exaiptasia diaphana]